MTATQVFDRLAGTLDLLGLEGRLLHLRGGRAGLLRRAVLHARHPDGRRRTRRNGSTPACTGPTASTARARAISTSTPSPASSRKSKSAYEHPQPHACFIQSRRRRPRQRGRHHGPVGARGAPVQVRLGHRLQLLAPARRRREALGRRQLVGPDVLPQDRRPRGRRHQVGRHDAPRGQDGRRRRRPSRHRELHRLEGEGGAEGRRPRRPAPRSSRSTSRPS